MNTITSKKNWKIAQSPEVLENIHLSDINIAIYERDISTLEKEVKNLIEKNIELRATGDVNDIQNELARAINSDEFTMVMQDIKTLLIHFKNVSGAKNFRLLLATVNTNMCRKFHTDVNDLRLLCTYSGPGTLWLPEDNLDRNALADCAHNECVVLDDKNIRQAKTGDVVILKGNIYPKEATKAIVHRSPTIEESGKKRLLLRIDTNEFLNF